jgi:hypothetical protein
MLLAVLLVALDAAGHLIAIIICVACLDCDVVCIPSAPHHRLLFLFAISLDVAFGTS